MNGKNMDDVLTSGERSLYVQDAVPKMNICVFLDMSRLSKDNIKTCFADSSIKFHQEFIFLR